MQKSPSSGRKNRPRSAQLKLAGIATDQTELSMPADDHQNPPQAGSNPV
jgi:ribonuclease-3